MPASPAPTRSASADELAAELEQAFEAAGPGTVAAFVAEPIVGATLAAAVPPDGYWPAIAEVCRRHGVLLIADEVMTGFGRTGRWFADRPLGRPAGHPGRRQGRDRRATGRSASWPRAARSTTTVPAAPASSTASPTRITPVGAAVAREVLRILEDESLVEASAAKGERLSALASAAFGDHPDVGEIRGRGLMVGIELVADRETRAPFPRAARLTETVVARRARARASSSTRAPATPNGVDGDTILLGPPFVVTDAELERIVAVLAESIESWRRRSAERAARAARRTVSYAVRRFHPEIDHGWSDP